MSTSAGRAVVCELCPRLCRIADGEVGDCRIRVNLDGKLLATTYGRPAAIHIDPIEKKPLFHYYPGTPVLSLATAGCNLHCLNCQNWQLSQRAGHEMESVYRAEPDEVVALAQERECPAIAYTYSEPLVYYEYTRDTAERARAAGLRNVIVSAAYVRRRPLRRLCRVIDAATIDVKSFDDAFYREYCGGSLKPVLDALVTMREEGLWLEVSNLVIPSLTDDLGSIRQLARWTRQELGEDTPFHFLRFFPHYRMQNLPPTPAVTLERARDEARQAGLRHVYIGNLLGHEGENTVCPKDGALLMRRQGYRIVENHLDRGRCPRCGLAIAGRWG